MIPTCGRLQHHIVMWSCNNMLSHAWAQDLGWPCKRKRYMSWAVKDASFVWAGPPTSEGVLDEFLSIFARSCQLECDVFTRAGDAASDYTTLQDLAKRRAKFVTPQALATAEVYTDLRRYLPPVGRRIFDQLLEEYAGGKGPRVGLGGGFCGDLTQTGSFLRCGAIIPTLTRGTELFSLSAQHYYTNEELEFSQGWPSLSLVAGCSKYAGCIGYDLTKLHTTQRRRLRGNGMHLAALGAWMVYCMSRTVRRSQFTGFFMVGALPCSDDGDSSDEDVAKDDDADAPDEGGTQDIKRRRLWPAGLVLKRSMDGIVALSMDPRPIHSKCEDI